MPSAVLVKGVLEAVAVAFCEEFEDVATCFVPNRRICHYPTGIFNSFNSIIYMIVVIKVGLLYKVFSNEKAVITYRT